MSDEPQIETGDTLNVTIKTNGTESDGQFSVVETTPTGPAKVQNESGDTFDLVIDRGNEGVLGKHGNEIATVHNIEVA